MALMTSRRVWLGLLVVAVGALLVDKLYLGSEAPAPAEAASARRGPTPAPPTAAAPSPQPAEPAPPPGPGDLPLADRLEALAGEQPIDTIDMRDAFALSDVWHSELTVEEAPEIGPTPGERFVSGHRLTSVLLGGKRSLAVVDGRAVRLGQALEGFTLVEVTAETAVFASDEERVELRINR
jgi:hypothetical protein